MRTILAEEVQQKRSHKVKKKDVSDTDDRQCYRPGIQRNTSVELLGPPKDDGNRDEKHWNCSAVLISKCSNHLGMLEDNGAQRGDLRISLAIRRPE